MVRELTGNEVRQVSGGFTIYNLPSIPGGVSLAWNIGVGTGTAINDYNASLGRNLGESIYWATH